MSKALTDTMIRNARPPATGRIEVADGACRGLVLRVTSNGIRSFGFRFRDRTTGRSERVLLGHYPDLMLRDARHRADALRREVAAGKNPSANRREASDCTFAALADRYLAEHSRRFKKSAHLDEGMLRLHILPHWRDRDFTTLERADLIKLVERIVTAGKPVAANRVQALISSIFSFALDADLVKANPCARMRRRGEERPKDRVLTDDEIRLFWSRAVLPPVSRLVGLALRLILVTGCRPGEVAGMAKAEIEVGPDGSPTAWTVPALRSKNGRPHYVPLSPMAQDLVAESMQLSSKSAYVFRARYGDGGHVTAHAVTVAMGRLGEAVPEGEPGADTWHSDPPTPHDLRRTAATRLSAAGVRPEDVAAVLNHARRDITGKHYDQYARTDEKRTALDRWSAILSGILEPGPADNVVALRA